MTEPTVPSDEIPPTLPAGLRINWHRVRVYLLSILLMVSMWVCASLLTIQFHPKRVIDGRLAQLPFPSSTGKVFWMNRRTLKIEDVKFGGFFYADSIIFTASPWGLMRHHIAKVEIRGGQLFTKPFYAALDQFHGRSNSLDWTIGRFEITRGTLMLDNLVADTAIPVRLGVRHPIVLRGIHLGQPDSSSRNDEGTNRRDRQREYRLASSIRWCRSFSFPLTRVRFTYTELWHHRIREIDLVKPTMFLGEDLFWLSHQFKTAHSAALAHGPTAPWEFDHFEVQYGQLAVNAFGQPVVRFPFFFQTKVDNIRLDQLDQISAKSVIGINRLDQDYPDYKIRIVDLEGQLYFSLPPTDATANNVVNTITIGEVSWNNIPMKGINTTVTFDPNGVYGKATGTCEGGQVAGNFEFYYTKGFTWNANLFANKINCQPIAQKMIGKYVDLTGELNGQITAYRAGPPKS